MTNLTINDDEFEELVCPIEIIVSFYFDTDKKYNPTLKTIYNELNNSIPDLMMDYFKDNWNNDSVIFPIEFSVIKRIMNIEGAIKTWKRNLEHYRNFSVGVSMKYKYMGLLSRYSEVMKCFTKQIEMYQIEKEFIGFNISIGKTIGKKPNWK